MFLKINMVQWIFYLIEPKLIRICAMLFDVGFPQ